MAVNRQNVLKRCRKLELEPGYLGSAKRSKKKPAVFNRKMSEYALQLREKQKAKFLYGVLERQFRNYFDKANKTQGITGENLLRLLELRLDNVVFRLGFARTRKEARQIVSHKHILVNGKRVNIPSYQVKLNDEIRVREKSRDRVFFSLISDAARQRAVPEWLSVQRDNFVGYVDALPNRAQIDAPVSETLIVELYSK